MSLGSSARGCGGSRDRGAAYMECGGSGPGLPIYELIQDPVKPVDPATLGLSPVGVKLVEVNGVWHVFDWVGEKHYPNAADFIEEAVRLGVSRRISLREELKKLTPASRLFLVHPKAYWTGGKFRSHFKGSIPCPTGKHPEPCIECTGNLWLAGKVGCTDLDPFNNDWPRPDGLTPEWAPRPVEIVAGETAAGGAMFSRRKMPAFEYLLREGDEELTPGVIMVVPIERIALVDDPDDPAHITDSLRLLSESSIPSKLETQ